MSDEQIDLGEQPEPKAETPQLEPGGVDAVPQPDYDESPPVSRDPGTTDNPAVDDEVPDEIATDEDKQQEGSESDPEDDTSTESAG